MKILSLALTSMLLAACSSEPVDNTAALAVCARLADRCHPYEAVSLTAADCHRYAHANNTAMCVAREPECLAACPTLSDAGVGDAGSTDGALPPSQCTQLGSICHDSTTALGMACHDLGHGGTPATCAARYAACVAECSPRDAGAD